MLIDIMGLFSVRFELIVYRGKRGKETWRNSGVLV